MEVLGSDPGRGLTPAFGLFAGAARRPDDHEQLARAGATRKRLRLDAELFREPQRHALAPRREVHRRLRIAEVRRAADFLDRVPEAADMARDLPRVVDVAAAVQHRYRAAP